jgi:hypothetical protein
LNLVIKGEGYSRQAQGHPSSRSIAMPHPNYQYCIDAGNRPHGVRVSP